MKTGIIGIIGQETEQDLWGTMQRIADMGYNGIEGGPLALLEGDVKSNIERYHALGLQVITVGAFMDDITEHLDELIQRAKVLHASHITLWQFPFTSGDDVRRIAQLLDDAGSKIAAAGLKLLFHNHENEFQSCFSGASVMEMLAVLTKPENLYFELDIAWAAFAGMDPVQIIRKLGNRIAAIHVKDLSRLDERNHFTAIGTGLVNVRGSVEAAEACGVEWVIVEQDQLRSLSAFDTLQLSRLALKEWGVT